MKKWMFFVLFVGVCTLFKQDYYFCFSVSLSFEDIESKFFILLVTLFDQGPISQNKIWVKVQKLHFISIGSMNVFLQKLIHFQIWTIQLPIFTEKFSLLPGFEPGTSLVPRQSATNWAILTWILLISISNVFINSTSTWANGKKHFVHHNLDLQTHNKT